MNKELEDRLDIIKDWLVQYNNSTRMVNLIDVFNEIDDIKLEIKQALGGKELEHLIKRYECLRLGEPPKFIKGQKVVCENIDGVYTVIRARKIAMYLGWNYVLEKNGEEIVSPGFQEYDLKPFNESKLNNE